MKRSIIAIMALSTVAASAANRCRIEGTWITLDGNILYTDRATKLREVYNMLVEKEVCDTKNSRLGVDFPYLTLDGRIAFGDYSGRKQVLIEELVNLSQAGGGSNSTTRCTALIRRSRSGSLSYRVVREGRVLNDLSDEDGYNAGANAYLHFLNIGMCT